jgi:cysteine-rich repeat protein
MSSRRLIRGAMVGTLFATMVAGRAEAAPEGCVLEAATSLRVDNGSTLDGDVLVTELGGKAKLGRQVFAADDTTIAADKVSLGRNASVFDVLRSTLALASDAVIRGTDGIATFPRQGACALPELACGSEDIHVEKHGALLLLPGSYGHLTIEDDADIAIAPGTYAFCSIRTGRNVVLAVGPGTPPSIGIVGDLVLGDGTLLEAPPGSAIPTIAVGGAKVKLPGNSQVDAFIRSPLARLTIGRSTAFTGGACAETIKLGREVAFHCATEGTATTTSTTGTLPTSTSSSTTTSSTSTSQVPSTSTSTSVGPTTTSSSTTTVLGTTSTSSSSTSSSTTSSSSTTGTIPTTTSTSSAPTTSTTSGPTTSTTTAPTPTTTIGPTTSTTSTSSTTTTSTTEEPTTSSSSTIPQPTTTSTSSTTSTSTTTSTSSTTSPAGCGNGNVGTGETCDDGNNIDNDTCPADCRIAACTPVTTTQRFVQVHFQAPLGALVAGLTVLVDYPEGQVDLPGAGGASFPSGTISGTPTGATIGANDLSFNTKGHAVRLTVAGQGGNALHPGQVIRFRFQDCQGAQAPTPANFLCTVLAATDPFLNPVSGVQCFVVIE